MVRGYLEALEVVQCQGHYELEELQPGVKGMGPELDGWVLLLSGQV